MLVNKSIFKHPIIKTLISFLVFFIALFIIALMLWLKKEFGEVSFDQVLYHLQFGSEGILSADDGMIRSFFNKCILTPSVVALIATTINKSFIRFIVSTYSTCKNKLAAAFQHSKLPSHLTRIAPHYYLLFIAIIFAGHRLAIFPYITDHLLPNAKDFYAEQYKDPRSTNLISNKPRNLVLIYVESLESTYSNLSVFDENFIQNVSTDALGGTSFSRQRQAAGTEWTMAGIVSTQCGVPLRAPLGGVGERRRNQVTELTPNFLPSIACLGDVLKERGFHSVFMGGASLAFAGKGNFFKTHGYDEIYGREEFVSMLGPKLPLNHWGLYDDDLLKAAQEKIDELEKKDKPYNLTILTLDTHQPEGNLSKTCIGYGATKFKDIVRCSARIVSEFVNEMDRKGYLENTTVVLLGDHLAMTNPMINKLNRSQDRLVFNNYITKNLPLHKNRDEITSVDHFPSILDSMNIKVEGGKLGLGISGFGNVMLPNNKDRFELLDKYGTKASKTYMEFWNGAKNGAK